MKIAPREQFILTVVGSVLLILIMVAALVYPSFKSLGRLDNEIAQARSEVSGAKSMLAQRQAIKNRSAATDLKWLTLANQVPDNPDLPALIIELQDTAFDSGVQLVEVTPSLPVSEGAFFTVPITVRILGTWADTIDYLQRVAKLGRGLRIVQFNSGVTTNEGQSTVLNSELPDYFENSVLVLEAYMIPASPTTTPTAAPVPAPAGP